MIKEAILPVGPLLFEYKMADLTVLSCSRQYVIPLDISTHTFSCPLTPRLRIKPAERRYLAPYFPKNTFSLLFFPSSR